MSGREGGWQHTCETVEAKACSAGGPPAPTTAVNLSLSYATPLASYLPVPHPHHDLVLLARVWDLHAPGAADGGVGHVAVAANLI